MNRLYQSNPHFLSEMYGYVMAAAHERLPHLLVRHYMVSNVEVRAIDEAWLWVDELPQICQHAIGGMYYPGYKLPTVLHYCQTYRIGGLEFEKRNLAKNMFDCDHPLFVELHESRDYDLTSTLLSMVRSKEKILE